MSAVEERIAAIKAEIAALEVEQERLKALRDRTAIYEGVEKLSQQLNIPHIFVSKKELYLDRSYCMNEDLCLFLVNDVPYMISWDETQKSYELRRIQQKHNVVVETGGIVTIQNFLENANV